MRNNKLLIATTLLFSHTYVLHGMEQELEILEKEYKEVLTALVIKSQRPNGIYIPMWHSNERRIAMWNSTAITSTPNIKSPLIISTDELDGRLTTALHIKYDNGDQYAGITHYPPSSTHFSFERQRKAIKMQCVQALNNQNETKKIIATNFFFTSPKKNEHNSPLSSYPSIPSLNHLSYKISDCDIHIKLKNTGTIQSHFISYDMFHTSGSNEKCDVELILYPDKATFRIKDNELINL